jgi:hypothetical protein
VTQNYICTTCKKKFSRKWNANRHNNTVHYGMSDVFNNETRIVMNNKKLYSDDTVGGVYQEDLIEQITLDLFGKMLQNFEVLENLFSHKTEDEKNRILSSLLLGALITPNPVKSLNDAISFGRSLRAKFKFVNYISKNKRIPTIMAESILINLVKNNQWIKKKKPNIDKNHFTY